MGEFTLPANSKIGEGKRHAGPASPKKAKTFRVYRWHPDDGANPRIDSYVVDMADCGPMVLRTRWIRLSPSGAPAARACAVPAP
jgi:succinate dehydrogenase / fumarate reductase iron-sulfur subunit